MTPGFDEVEVGEVLSRVFDDMMRVAPASDEAVIYKWKLPEELEQWIRGGSGASRYSRFHLRDASRGGVPRLSGGAGMMLKLNNARPLVRQTALEYRGVPLVIAMRSRMISIRPKGTHQWFDVDYETLFDLARKLDARRQSAERISA